MSDDQEMRIAQLDARVRRLESEMGRLRATVDETAAPSSLPRPPAVRLERLVQRSPSAEAPGSDKIARSDTAAEGRPFFVESETVLKWGGVGLVVLAVGFAVSTAVSRGWIGPELQLAGAVGASLGLVAAGLRLRSTRPSWTHALCSGGVLALFSTIASDLFLDQTSANIAFTGAAVIGLGGYVLAREVSSEWVGSVNLIGGIIGWLVIADGEVPFHASLAWFVALVAVAVALSLENRWFALRFLGHGVGLVAILSMAVAAEAPTEQVVIFVAAALLYSSLVRVPSIGDLTSTWQQLDIQLATVAAPWAFAIISVTLDFDDDPVVGSVAMIVAGVGALIALGVRRWIQPAHLGSLLIGASVSLSIGSALLLSTSVVYVALAIQGAGLVILSRSLGNSIRVLVNAAVVSLIAFASVLGEMLDAWTNDASVGDDIAHVAVIAALAAAAWQTGRRHFQQAGAVAVLVLVLIWLGSVLVHLPQGQAMVSVSWAVLGTALLVTGAIRKVPELGTLALAVLGLTVAKLLTVDLREVDTLWRAGLFFIVGFGIMRLGFLLPRLTGTAAVHPDRQRGP